MEKVVADTVGQNDFTDWHSQSNAKEMHPEHLSLDILVNFDKHQISGSATWTIRPDKGTQYAVFDTRQMKIDSVLYADGSVAPFEMGKVDSILGSALKITLRPGTRQLTIYYKTGAGATALQWLTPAQTFGKKSPFLYTQSESIYARTWVPCPDGPGYRFTYDAKVTVPRGLLALMSAENPLEADSSGVYHFKMTEKIPAYLLALAVGDIGFKKVDQRTGIYAEPAILDRAGHELDGMGKMVNTAESLYGPYRWGRYDVLVLPSGFPMGGMENPRLTFCTPTILAGDKSLVNLVAHELAHSWSGNLVTNATWDDFWLNEGFTVYFERRITEAEYGKDYVAMLWTLGAKDLEADVNRIGRDSRDTWLKEDLKGRDPDIGFTDIPYEKGSAFLLLVEQTVGRGKWDAFLNKYFKEHAFQSMTTERFLNYLNKNLLNGHDDWKKAIDINAWIYAPGIPANMPHVQNPRFVKVDSTVKAFLKHTPAKDLPTKGWSTYEWLHFLGELPADLAYDQMRALDETFKFTQTGNSEIADVWFLHALQSRYTPAYPAMKQFLYVTGREKFLEPLYREMTRTPEGRKMASEIYKIARPNYHPLAQKDIDHILGQ
ncbi:MAG TPA: M1 family metallopeptidase [Edaphocola sp.]|nr:M1 family metallopeptidase [Edaphocola sp.]